MEDQLQQILTMLIECDDRLFAAASPQMANSFSVAALQSSEARKSRQIQIEEFKAAGYTKQQVVEEMAHITESFKELLDELKEQVSSSQAKQEFIDKLCHYIELNAAAIVDEYNENKPMVQIELAHPDAKLPTYAHPGDQGADVYAIEDVVLPPHSYGNMISTGLKMNIPDGWAIAIRPRSGLSRKTGLRISNTPATIDTNYRGFVNILFDNVSSEKVKISKGDRIAQLILERNYQASFAQVKKVSEDTERGGAGFGSSGT